MIIKNLLKKCNLIILNKYYYYFNRCNHILSRLGLRDEPNLIFIKSSFSSQNELKKKVLYVDAETPMPDQNSGSIDALNFMKILKGLGYEVTFVPESNFIYRGTYTDDLISAGIKPIFHPEFNSIKQIAESGVDFELIILCRSYIGDRYIDSIKEWWPSAKIIFYTVDLHFLREEREAKLLNSEALAKAAIESKNMELAVIKKADVTIVLSEYERELLKALTPECEIYVVPLIRDIRPRNTAKLDQKRKNIVFIGTYQHPPNLDAVKYFIDEIWPLISKELPKAKFIVAGSMVTGDLQKISGQKNIEVIGYVKDLERLYSSCRVSVAPLRFGAGLKGKISTSMELGVPVVATSIAAEGMNIEDGYHYLKANSPREFADKVIQVCRDNYLWGTLSLSGYEYVTEAFSIESAKKIIDSIISKLLINKNLNEKLRETIEDLDKFFSKELKLNKFWSKLSSINKKYLIHNGIDNFKVTVNNNYFQWLPGDYKDNQVSALFKYWSNNLNNVPIEIISETKILDNVTKNQIKTWGGDGISPFDNPHYLSFYIYFVGLLWNYAIQNDPLKISDEIEEPKLGGCINISYRGKLISQDLANSIIEWSSIREMCSGSAGMSNKIIMELGAGYGRLAYVFLYANDCKKYIISDINPALSLSQVYLSELFHNRKIFKFRDFNNFDEIQEEFNQSEICFISPSQINFLPKNYIDITITISTLHEMNHEEIENYKNLFTNKTSENIYMKQWNSWKNEIDNINICAKDFMIDKKEWKLVRNELNATHNEFIEIGYKKVK
ncbi:putative sugar O-methyltransferase [Polynucleobacter paneuropaeus]|nr:putative sugar O-methyltransferase [Polynucleobacter paneuropaeus]